MKLDIYYDDGLLHVQFPKSYSVEGLFAIGVAEFLLDVAFMDEEDSYPDFHYTLECSEDSLDRFKELFTMNLEELERYDSLFGSDAWDLDKQSMITSDKVKDIDWNKSLFPIEKDDLKEELEALDMRYQATKHPLTLDGEPFDDNDNYDFESLDFNGYIPEALDNYGKLEDKELFNLLNDAISPYFMRLCKGSNGVTIGELLSTDWDALDDVDHKNMSIAFDRLWEFLDPYDYNDNVDSLKEVLYEANESNFIDSIEEFFDFLSDDLYGLTPAFISYFEPFYMRIAH